MRRYLAALTVGILLAGGIAYAGAPQHRQRDTYQLWRGGANAPLSVVIRHRCARAEDSAAHLKLVAYSGSKAVYDCNPEGW